MRGCDRSTETDRVMRMWWWYRTRSRSTNSPWAVLSMLSRPARGPGSCFGLLLIKPVMSWKVAFAMCVCVCVRQCACMSFWQTICDREDCALNIGAKSNIINRSHKQITTPLVLTVIDPSVTHNFNRERYERTGVAGKATTTIAAEGKGLWFQMSRYWENGRL